MTTQGANNRKKLAISGAIIGLFLASLKRREHVNVTTAPNEGPGTFSRRDWKEVFLGARDSITRSNIPTLAAGVAYFSTLALFPMLAAIVAVSALLIKPSQLETLIASIDPYLPSDIAGVVSTQLQSLIDRRTDNLFAAIVATSIALFSASGASKNLVIASNVAYGVKETRGWLAQQGWGLLWTILGILFGFLVMALLAVNRGLLEYVNLPEPFVSWILFGRWGVILLSTILSLAVFYRYGPNRSQVRWQWVSWGAVIATTIWFFATLLFFVYVQNFANFSQSYSLFAGIVVLMIWMNLSALIVLIGAVINHQLEVAGQKKWDDLLRGHES
jgi:membrane protein